MHFFGNLRCGVVEDYELLAHFMKALQMPVLRYRRGDASCREYLTTACYHMNRQYRDRPSGRQRCLPGGDATCFNFMNL